MSSDRHRISPETKSISWCHLSRGTSSNVHSINVVIFNIMHAFKTIAVASLLAKSQEWCIYEIYKLVHKAYMIVLVHRQVYLFALFEGISTRTNPYQGVPCSHCYI